MINIGAHQAIGGNDRSTPLLEQLPGAVPCAALHRISVLDKAILNRNGEIGHSLTVRRKALPRGAQAAQACNEADPPLPLFDQRGNAPVDGLIRGHRHGGKRRSVYLPVGQNSGEGRRKHRRKLAVGLHGRCQQDPVHNSGGKIPQMLQLTLLILLCVRDDQMEALCRNATLNSLDQTGEELVGNIRDHKTNDILLSCAETAGKCIWCIPQLSDCLHHKLS